MRILRTLVCGVFLFVLAVSMAAQSSEPLPFTLKPLGNGVYAAIDDAKGDAGANAGFVIGDDGVAVIDTFENEKAARALLAEIRKLTPLPIKFVINTHYHLDHVAGNKVFQGAGAAIVAHRNVRDWIHTENLKFFGKDIKPEQKAEVENLASPNIGYDDSVALFLGSRQILVKHLLGHTGGDSVVTIPDAKVIFWGDLFWRKTLPNLIDATAADWIKTLTTQADANRKSEFVQVPGHGDVGNAQDVEEFCSYLSDLRSMVSTAAAQEKTGEQLMNAVLPELTKKYGKWDFFEDFAKSNIKDMEAELKGNKRKPGQAEPH